MRLMGETGKSGLQNSTHAMSPAAVLRALRLAAMALGVTLVMAGNVAHAADDDEQPEESFEQSIINSIMRGIGGTNIEDSGIDYRERSPLVVPSKIDLPPPESNRGPPVPNWPKDPDVQARQEAIAAARGSKKTGPNGTAWEGQQEAQRPLMPSELASRPKQRNTTRNADGTIPGAPTYESHILSPTALGYTGGLFSNMFGSSKEETVPFKEEPKRESLVQPPTGYQTPSANFAYGAGPLKSVTKDPYNPLTDK